MNDELEKSQRLLEAVTAAGETPADALDPEAASLREAWLAFGDLLESAQVSPHPLREGQRVRAVRLPTQRRWLLPMAGALAASLLICIATAWMLRDTIRHNAAAPAPSQTASVGHHAVTPSKAAASTDSPQWDDSLDEQFSQLDQQMTSVRENQLSSTDDFAVMQYRIDQFRQEVQADTL
jgi:hypothetical protein